MLFLHCSAGSGQSVQPQQTRSTSTGQPKQHQRNGPAQSSRAGRQQPQGQARSSPLYAESEGEESETESSAGGSAAADEAEQQQQQVEAAQKEPVVPEPRQTRTSGQASRATAKPPTGRAKAKPTAPPRDKAAFDLPKGRRQAAPTDEEDVEGFGLFSEDQEPARQSRAGRPKPDSKAQVTQEAVSKTVVLSSSSAHGGCSLLILHTIWPVAKVMQHNSL